MTNTPDNIRNMWEEAAKSNPYNSQQSPGMGSGITPPTAGQLGQLRKPKPLTPEELKAKEEAAAKEAATRAAAREAAAK